MSDAVKMIRETLCVAQAAVAQLPDDFRAGRSRDGHIDQLGRLIELCDLLRPLGHDGKHGDLHTAWCGCDRGDG